MENRTVLITGASSGIGFETALLLNKNGYKVFASARRLHKMKKLAEVGIKILAMDVTREESMVKGIEQILQETERIDVLINNAGFGLSGPLEEISVEDGRYQFEVNVIGMARLIQLVLPSMRMANQGTIINISSVAGLFGEALGSWYHSSKYAVEGFSNSLWRELKPFGIKVIVIRPGCIKTNWDGIVTNNLMRVSKETTYNTIKKERINIFNKLYGERHATHPIVVGETILKALMAREPKLTYAVGAGAREIVFLRKYLGERTFFKISDFVVRRILKRK